MPPEHGRRKTLLIAAALLVVAAGAAAAWWQRPQPPANELMLYGNIDLRQVSLAFNGNERIETVTVEEGTRVHKGDAMATLDTSRLQPQVERAEAQLAAQKAAVERLHNGSRPEEIAQARANLRSAQADATNARAQYARQRDLVQRNLASRQDLDNTKAAADAADAKVDLAQKTLDLEIAGPRAEDIAQAEAELDADRAALALLQQQLRDATLVAPLDAVVRSRLLEPGDMASPQSPVFSLAITDPKWVRAYVSETDLGRVRPGLEGTVSVDSFPDRRFDGRVGFISPVAEFTPKTVQTAELRTSLVYEVRVLVTDPNDELRLGTPATVHLPIGAAAGASDPATR